VMIEERRGEVRRLLEGAEKFCELAERSRIEKAAEKAWLKALRECFAEKGGYHK